MTEAKLNKKEIDEVVIIEPSLTVWQRYHKLLQAVFYVQKEEKTVNKQYRFASHDGVVRAVRSHIIESGLIVVSRIVEKTLELQQVEETVLIFDAKLGSKVPMLDNNGAPVVKMTMAYVCTILMEFDFINPDNSSEVITINGFGMGIDPQDKATGKAMSYAKKYALLNALLLETGDDSEQDVNMQIAKSKPIDPQELFKDLLGNVVDKALTKDAMTANWKARSIDIAKLKQLSPEFHLKLEGYAKDKSAIFESKELTTE